MNIRIAVCLCKVADPPTVLADICAAHIDADVRKNRGVGNLASMYALLAHVGGRTDLPVPLSFFIVGAGLAIVVSFVALSASWLEPRLQGEYERRSHSMRGIRIFSNVLAGLGAIGLALVVANGPLNGGTTSNSIGVVLVWIVFWLAVPFASVVVGGLWRWISPYRRIVHYTSGGVSERPELLERIGVWPAVVAFVAFVWLELVYPDNTMPATLAAAAVVYGIYLFVLSRRLGPETALRSGAAFEMYTGVISRIAPVELVTTPNRGPARLERRRWLAALPHMPTFPGTAPFIIAMIGTVTYDGMAGAGWWADMTGDVRREMWFETIALIATCLVIGAAYYGASRLAARLAGNGRSTAEIAAGFAHTLVPIAFAYAFAHYFSLIVFEGQQLLHVASDPFGRGWDLLGTADWRVVFTPSQLWIWYVQVIVIVLGHIAGVVLAHDRALAEFDQEVAVRTQYAMLVLMVTLTGLGLFILAG